MWGKRLKEKIQWNPQGSPFAAWIAILLVLMAVISVFVALGDTHFLRDLTNSDKSSSSNRAVTLTASGNHTYYWDQSGPFPIEDFRERLSGWLKTTKKPSVSIAGDSTASFGDTVRLINEVRHQGIEDFHIDAQARARP